MRDINLTVLSGVVANTPNVVPTRNNSRICLFNLKVTEKFRHKDGSPGFHENYLTIEALGKNVDKCMNEITKGDRLILHGYLRVDDVNGVEKVRARAYYIEKE